MANKQGLIRTIIFLDNLLNWFMSILLVFLPNKLIFFFLEDNPYPVIYWQIFGAGFMLFCIYQDILLIRGSIHDVDFKILSFFAIWPVIGLTYALLFMDLNFYLIPKVLAWIGNLYMVVLAALYWHHADHHSS